MIIRPDTEFFVDFLKLILALLQISYKYQLAEILKIILQIHSLIKIFKLSHFMIITIWLKFLNTPFYN